MQARLESPRRPPATLGLRPGGLAPIDGGSSRRSTVMRLGPSGQSAHIRVIRRRSRLVVACPQRLRIVSRPRGAPPVGAPRGRGWVRHREEDEGNVG